MSLSVEAAAKGGWLTVRGTFPVESLLKQLLRSLAMYWNASSCDSNSKNTTRKIEYIALY
jgi:hypothetical protein